MKKVEVKINEKKDIHSDLEVIYDWLINHKRGQVCFFTNQGDDDLVIQLPTESCDALHLHSDGTWGTNE